MDIIIFINTHFPDEELTAANRAKNWIVKSVNMIENISCHAIKVYVSTQALLIILVMTLHTTVLLLVTLQSV